eukprot:scaffold64342_cov48-Attheya_sp.AAC.2
MEKKGHSDIVHMVKPRDPCWANHFTRRFLHICDHSLRKAKQQVGMMRFCMNDPLVKWLSDVFPIIISNDHEFVDPHNEETIDGNGINFQTITDVKKEQWNSYAYHVLGIEDRNRIRKYSIFDDFEDHIDYENLSGNMNNELDIDFRFDGPTDSFEIKSTVGTVLGTASYIFEVLIMKELMRSKRDYVGNELKEGAVEYIADEIAEDMYKNMFKELLHEMMSIIEEQDKDAFNWD